MTSMETELTFENNKRKLFILTALVMLLITLLSLFVLSIGLFDPKPLGQLAVREEFDQSIRIDDEYLLPLTGEYSSSEYTVRLSAAWNSGDHDVGYGLQLGDEAEGTIVAVSSLGYVTLQKQHDNRAPVSGGLSFQDADHLIPWQTWSHVNEGDQSNEIWIDIEDSSSPKDDMRLVYHEKGAACFARGEGMWFGEGDVYFCCTNGGENKCGQIWRYTPSPLEGTDKETTRPGELELFLESDSTELLEMCDNVTMAPWGDLIICEDGTGEQFVRGIALDGTVYNIAKNHSGSEFAGACFSPGSPNLFVNIQTQGLTLEITGPWDKRQFV